MTTSDTAPEPFANDLDQTFSWTHLVPRARGVIDLVDDMLLRCRVGRMRLTWQAGMVTEIPYDGGPATTFDIRNLRNSVFRAVLARLAFLCKPLSADAVTPYGGKGVFIDPRWPDVRFRVDFMNTPAEQRLELTPQAIPEFS